jgi:hypothetical protein
VTLRAPGSIGLIIAHSRGLGRPHLSYRFPPTSGPLSQQQLGLLIPPVALSQPYSLPDSIFNHPQPLECLCSQLGVHIIPNVSTTSLLAAGLRWAGGGLVVDGVPPLSESRVCCKKPQRLYCEGSWALSKAYSLWCSDTGFAGCIWLICSIIASPSAQLRQQAFFSAILSPTTNAFFDRYCC